MFKFIRRDNIQNAGDIKKKTIKKAYELNSNPMAFEQHIFHIYQRKKKNKTKHKGSFSGIGEYMCGF